MPDETFTVTDSEGLPVETGKTTWMIRDDVLYVYGNRLCFSGRFAGQMAVENADVAAMTFDDFHLSATGGYGLTLVGKTSMTISLRAQNSIDVSGYADAASGGSPVPACYGISTGVRLTFTGDGSLDVACAGIATGDIFQKAVAYGLYAYGNRGDVIFDQTGDVRLRLDGIDGAAATSTMACAAFAVSSLFCVRNGCLWLDVGTVSAAEGTANAYGLYGRLTLTGGMVSAQVAPRGDCRTGKWLALWTAEDPDPAITVRNAEKVDDHGYQPSSPDQRVEIVAAE